MVGIEGDLDPEVFGRMDAASNPSGSSEVREPNAWH